MQLISKTVSRIVLKITKLELENQGFDKMWDVIREDYPDEFYKTEEIKEDYEEECFIIKLKKKEDAVKKLIKNKKK